MQKKLAALAIAALLSVSMSGCAAGTNTDNGTKPLFPDDSITNGDYDTDTSRTYSDKNGLFSTDRDRFDQMLENGHVRDTDGYLRNDR